VAQLLSGFAKHLSAYRFCAKYCGTQRNTPGLPIAISHHQETGYLPYVIHLPASGVEVQAFDSVDSPGEFSSAGKAAGSRGKRAGVIAAGRPMKLGERAGGRRWRVA